MHPDIAEYLEGLTGEFNQIEKGRQSALGRIAEYVSRKRATEKEARLVFICTHNSRRSHMAQIWAQTAAYSMAIHGVQTFSGGTEATSFNPRAVSAMRQAGFKIKRKDDSPNAVYSVSFARGVPSMEAYSKRFSDPINPQEEFCAVMVCAQADEACPVVFGSDLRVSIPYDDPKAFDNTPQESTKYNQRCHQIGRDITYLFSRVK
jgi:protein-tyrosine-phosphatase